MASALCVVAAVIAAVVVCAWVPTTSHSAASSSSATANARATLAAASLQHLAEASLHTKKREPPPPHAGHPIEPHSSTNDEAGHSAAVTGSLRPAISLWQTITSTDDEPAGYMPGFHCSQATYTSVYTYMRGPSMRNVTSQWRVVAVSFAISWVLYWASAVGPVQWLVKVRRRRSQAQAVVQSGGSDITAAAALVSPRASTPTMTAWGVCKSPKIVAPSQPATSSAPGLQRRKPRTAAHKAAVAAIPLPHASEPTANDIVDAASRVVSTLHACVAIALSLYMVLVDPEGPTLAQIVACPYNAFDSTHARDIVLCVTTGYLIYDFTLCIVHREAIGDLLTLVHHAVVVVAFATCILFGVGSWHLVGCLLMEASTPFVNLRSHLLLARCQDTVCYTVNGMLLVLSYFVCRIVVTLILLADMARGWNFMFRTFWDHLGVTGGVTHWALWQGIALCSLIVIQGGLNAYWFSKIMRHARRSCSRQQQHKRA